MSVLLGVQEAVLPVRVISPMHDFMLLHVRVLMHVRVVSEVDKPRARLRSFHLLIFRMYLVGRRSRQELIVPERCFAYMGGHDIAKRNIRFIKRVPKYRGQFLVLHLFKILVSFLHFPNNPAMHLIRTSKLSDEQFIARRVVLFQLVETSSSQNMYASMENYVNVSSLT